MEYQVHETSIIDDGCDIGTGTKIWHFCHIIKGSKIGKNCKLGQNVVVGPDVTIGDGVKIQNNVSVYKGVTLEDNVFCGPSVVFTNDLYPRSNVVRPHENTWIKEGASLGANSTILCGNTIGRFAVVGAGAVIVKDVPDNEIWAGNPAVKIGNI